MAESRTSTTWDIKVNARALRGLQKTLGEVFSKQTPREFNTAIGQVNRALEVNARKTQDVVAAMAKAKEGSEIWKKMAGELRGANKEGRDLERTLQNLDRANQRLKTTAARGAGAAAGRGVGGAGGAAGAAGGMGMRGLPQAPMPGMGALQTSLMAIPAAGMVAAGSLMAAAQTYQSRLRFEQARMQAAPYLMSSRAALGFTPTTREVAIEQPEPGTEEVAGGVIKPRVAGRLVAEVGTGQVARVGEAGLTSNELGASLYGPGGTIDRRSREVMGDTLGGMFATVVKSPLMMGAHEAMGFGSMFRDKEEKRLLREQRHQQLINAPTLAEALEPEGEFAERARMARAEAAITADPFAALGEERKKEAAAGTATSRTVREMPFDDAAMRRIGVRMGYNPAETMQMAGQLGQAAGRPIAADELGQAMALQRTLGLGAEQTGGAIRQLRYAGEISGIGAEQGGMEQVANLIGSAVALGLEGSEIAGYLQAQTGFLDQMAKQGIGVDIEQQRSLEASLAGSGIAAPWRAADIGRQFAQGRAQVGRGGAQSAAQFRMMRASGLTGEGGIEEMWKVRLGMQSPELATQMGLPSQAEAMSGFIESMRVEGVGQATQAGILQAGMQANQMQIGPEEALALAQGMQAVEAGQFQIDTEAAERLVKTVAPSVRAEAGIEAERVGIGAQVAGAMQDLERTTNNMAGTFTNVLGPALDVVSAGMQDFTQALETATTDLWSLAPPTSAVTNP